MSPADHPLPLMDGGQEVRRSIDYIPRHFPYVLRFTPVSQDEDTRYLFGFDEIIEEFLNANDIDIFLLVQETTPKIHYHLYLESRLQHDDLKKLTQTFLYNYYITRSRGFGTKQYSCLISHTPLNAIIYNLKQVGRQEYSGFSEEFIEQCRKMAFTKKSDDFEAELINLAKKFHDDKDITPTQFGADIALIYSSYDKRVHWKDIQGYVNSKIIKRDPAQAYLLASKNLSF